MVAEAMPMVFSSMKDHGAFGTAADFMAAKCEKIGQLSPGQEVLYSLHQTLEDKWLYNLAIDGTVDGFLDDKRLNAALQAVAMKHEALRTLFFVDDRTGKPFQLVHDQPRIFVEQKAVYDEADVKAEIAKQRRFVFDLETAPLMRVLLFSLPTRHHIAYVFHHIIMDGFSWQIFQGDIAKAYVGTELSPPVGQPIGITIKQRRKRESAFIQRELDFWRRTYDTLPDSLPLFSFAKVKNRPSRLSHRTNVASVTLDAKFARQVREKCKSMGIGQPHFYLATLAAFISRSLGVEDFNIGITHRNRAGDDEFGFVGYIVNRLPMRFRMQSNENFAAFARRTKQNFAAVLTNSRVSMDTVADAIGVSGKLFNIRFNSRMGFTKTTHMGDCAVEWSAAFLDSGAASDLVFKMTDNQSGELVLDFVTQKQLYGLLDTKRLLSWYRRAMEGFLADPSILVSDCPLASAADLQRAIEFGRGPRVPVDWPETLARRISDIAMLYPDSVAMKDSGGQKVSYLEMMERANRISKPLDECHPGSRIAILMHPSIDAICALVAIMRSGHVCVPLSPNYEADFLSDVLTECRPSLLLCQRETLELGERLVSSYGGIAVNATSAFQTPSQMNSGNIRAKGTEYGFLFYNKDPAGVPRGALTTHGGLLSYIWGISNQLGREVVLHHTAFGLNGSLEQIFCGLANGGTLVIASHQRGRTTSQIAEVMLMEQVTMTVMTPSEGLRFVRSASTRLRNCQSWTIALSLGEKVAPRLQQAFKNLDLPKLQLINVYGSVEAGLACSKYVVPYFLDASNDDLAGSTLPNSSIVIVDRNMKLLPAGLPGEICVAGVGSEMRYLDQSEETRQEAFSGDGLLCNEDVAKIWSNLYRSGKQGRILEDGLLRIYGQDKEEELGVETYDLASKIKESWYSRLQHKGLEWGKEIQPRPRL